MRYLCCGCNFIYAHKVLEYELIDEEDRCDSYIRITISSPSVTSGNFLCLAFNSIPNSLTSYPIKVLINDRDTTVVNRKGRVITTADLHECVMLSGIYTNSCRPKYTIC